MTIVAVVRPGWTDFDEQHRLIGSLDLPLNVRGKSQIPGIVARLKSLPKLPDAVLCGTAELVNRTAVAIAEAFDVSIRETDELLNLNQGLWQSSTIEEIEHRMSRTFRQWQEAPETICPPEGELWEDAVERVRHALKKPLRKFESLVIVASEPLATLVSSFLTGEPPDLAEAFPDEPRDPLIEVFETSGRDLQFTRISESPETRRSLESLTPLPETK